MPILYSTLRWLTRAGLALACLSLALIALYRFAPPVSTLMLARWATGAPVERQWRSLDQMPQSLRIAVIASEDGSFCTHHGVDWRALGEVVAESGSDGPARGASTLTMQVAKNLFLWPSRSFLRKGLEIPLALALDLIWPKRRVLEVYLNIAEWGDGVFGAEAAAQAYFGKPAAALSGREAALMAAALPNPLRRNPARPSRRQDALAGIIQRRLANAAPELGCVR